MGASEAASLTQSQKKPVLMHLLAFVETPKAEGDVIVRHADMEAT
jgi:hypothetical protein